MQHGQSVRLGQHRVQGEPLDLRVLVGEPADPQQQVGQGAHVDRRRAPVTEQHRRRPRFADQGGRVPVGQRRHPPGPVAEQVGGHSAEAEADHRAERRIVDDLHHAGHPGRDHRLDQHSRAEGRRHLGVGGAQGPGVGHVQPDRAEVEPVPQVGVGRLHRDREAQLVRPPGHRLPPGSRRPAGQPGDPVRRQQRPRTSPAAAATRRAGSRVHIGQFGQLARGARRQAAYAGDAGQRPHRLLDGREHRHRRPDAAGRAHQGRDDRFVGGSAASAHRGDLVAGGPGRDQAGLGQRRCEDDQHDVDRAVIGGRLAAARSGGRRRGGRRVAAE